MIDIIKSLQLVNYNAISYNITTLDLVQFNMF